MSWEKVKLGDICEINIGKTPSRNISSYWGGNNKWISISDLKGKRYIEDTKENITEIAVKESGIKAIPPNTLLYSFKLSIGKLAITKDDIYSNEAIASLPILDKTKVSLDYLYWAMQTLQLDSVGDKAVMGITLNKAKLKNLEIPLPPLPIQEKIAAILDKADALRRKDQELLKKYDELAQAIFIDMFGDPVKNEKGWEVKRLGELILRLETGVSVNSSDKSPKGDDFCVLKTSAVYSGSFDASQKKVILNADLARAKLSPKKGSIIISRMNTPELVCKSAYIDRDYPQLFLPDRLWQTVKHEDTPHNTLWLSFVIGSTVFLNEVQKKASGTSGSMKNISKAKFLSSNIIYPPLHLQETFAEKIELINQLKAQTNAEKSEELFQSLLQRAFKGELVR